MYEIEDFAYFGSTLGNAIHSGLTVEQIWSCLVLSQTREQFDEAVSATIRLKTIQKIQGKSVTVARLSPKE